MNTIAAISTPQGVGGIGVIRISGEDATKIADKIFVPFVGEKSNCLQRLKGYTAKYGKISYNNEDIDEAVALVFKAPHSYTGEDVVEISCHGGIFLVRRVLRAILDSGASLAKPGEFTKRAFLNGKMDLSQAEAVMDLISAKSEKANKIAFNLREGVAGKKISTIKSKLVEIMAGLSVWADYPEDDVPEISSGELLNNLNKIELEIQKLIDGYDACKVLKNGVKTAIVGQPNVGKSTLMNLLAGCEKSIVTDIPGTTRDVIEETVMVGDIPLILTDTAGIRQTEDVIEKIGVKKSKESIEISDLTMLVIDASSPLSDYDVELLKMCKKDRTIIILNKCDLKIKLDISKLSTFSNKIVELSALKGSGIERLKEIVEQVVGIAKSDPADMLISNERQLSAVKKVKNLIEKAIAEIKSGMTLDAVTVLLQDATEVFMEFTGENASEAIVNEVFSRFCVGK